MILFNSCLTRLPWSIRASEWSRLEVSNRSMSFRSDLLYRFHAQYYIYYLVWHVPQQQYSWHRHENDNTATAHRFSYCVHKLERPWHKPTLARPSTRNSHYGIGGGRYDGCEPSSWVVDELLVLLLLWTHNLSCRTREPAWCFQPTEHAPHPGAVAARLGSKKPPRAMRNEAARTGRWWPWLDLYVVSFFSAQYPRVVAVDYSGSTNCCYINTWYLARGTCGI